MDEDFLDGEFVLEEDLWEVEDENEERPPEDGTKYMHDCVSIYCIDVVELQEEMEEMGLEEEGEVAAVKNDAMTVFRGHSGVAICTLPCNSSLVHFLSLQDQCSHCLFILTTA